MRDVTVFRRAGRWFVAAFALLVILVVLEATSPRTAALQEAARELGIASYTNGSLPIERYAEVLAATSGPLTIVAMVVSVAAWVLFAIAVWIAVGARASVLGWIARISGMLAVGGWLVMSGLEVILQVQGGTGFSAGFYGQWLFAEGLVGLFAATAVLGAVLVLRGAPLGRVLSIILIALSGLTAIGSLILVTAGGMPPIIGPLLGLILGIALLRKPRA